MHSFIGISYIPEKYRAQKKIIPIHRRNSEENETLVITSEDKTKTPNALIIFNKSILGKFFLIAINQPLQFDLSRTPEITLFVLSM